MVMRRFSGGGSAAGLATRRDGSGYVVEVLPRTNIKLGGQTVSSTNTMPLVQGVPAFDWVSGIVVVRLHQVVNTFPSTGTLSVNVGNVSIVDDDPSIVFSTGTTIASVGVTNPAPATNKLFVSALTAPIGPMSELSLVTLTGTTAGTFDLVLSIDLIGRVPVHGVGGLMAIRDHTRMGIDLQIAA